uniref:Uncharacterized protein n=1 Tax=Rhizophora mucronata TaxID=61149 RepID=A0A2P2N415_RHIMU
MEALKFERNHVNVEDTVQFGK